MACHLAGAKPLFSSTGILITEPLGRNFSEILIEIYTFSFKKIHLKMSTGKWHLAFCLGLNMLKIVPEKQANYLFADNQMLTLLYFLLTLI